MKDLERAASLDAGDPETLQQLGVLKENSGDYDAAIKLFTSLVSSRPDDPAAHFNLGVALGKKGRVSDAIRELTRSLELDPKNREALFKRAIAFEFLGDSKSSQADFAAGLRLPESEQVPRPLRKPVSTAHVKEMMTSR
jgi:tetratricopeptide (TPR) repeat protein